MVFIRSSICNNFKVLNYEEQFTSVSKLAHNISAKTGLPENFLLIYYNGKSVDLHQEIPHDAHIDVCFRMLGGKGGFGSMLRAIGAQIEKTTNREACRDLSGRRLRDINEEQRLKRWLAKKAEREEQQLKRRKEKLERMKAQPKHEFHDTEYNKERSELPERVDDALSQGFKKAILSKKHRINENKADEPPSKKKRAWLDDEILSDLSDDGSDIEQTSIGECSQTNSSNSLDPCSSSSNQDSNDVMLSSSSDLSQESLDKSSLKDAQTQKPIITYESDTKNLGNEQSTKPGKIEATRSNKSEEFKLNSERENIITSLQKPTEYVNKNCEDSENIEKSEKDNVDVDLLQFKSVAELENLGLDKLKSLLMKMGLKCGGTLSERAFRLWTVRNLDPKDYPKALKAKPSKK